MNVFHPDCEKAVGVEAAVEIAACGTGILVAWLDGVELTVAFERVGTALATVGVVVGVSVAAVVSMRKVVEVGVGVDKLGLAAPEQAVTRSMSTIQINRLNILHLLGIPEFIALP